MNRADHGDAILEPTLVSFGGEHSSSHFIRHFKSRTFAETFLEVLKILKIPSWSNLDNIDLESLVIHKVSGSLTNDVFFVSSPITRPHTLLLRVYGLSSGNLISRPYELHILHALSSHYGIGPKLYGTFENGRVEEHFDAAALTPSDLRDPLISSWVGARMAELHSADVDVVEPEPIGTSHFREIAVKRNVKSWLLPARNVLSLPSVSESIRRAFDLDTFEREWDSYMVWVSEMERLGGAGKRVFSHNDTQYGNLLRLNKPPAGSSPNRQVGVFPLPFFSPSHLYPSPPILR
jgi:choline kinase